jgi:hypothetical protein
MGRYLEEPGGMAPTERRTAPVERAKGAAVIQVRDARLATMVRTELGVLQAQVGWFMAALTRGDMRERSANRAVAGLMARRAEGVSIRWDVMVPAGAAGAVEVAVVMAVPEVFRAVQASQL